MTALDRHFGISNRNDFAMLERIGGECAGAVSLLPENMPPPAAGEMRADELSEKELEDIVAELPRRPLMVGAKGCDSRWPERSRSCRF